MANDGGNLNVAVQCVKVGVNVKDRECTTGSHERAHDGCAFRGPRPAARGPVVRYSPEPQGVHERLGYDCCVRVVIDHVGGSRRGQRQEFPANERIRFGRHPECEVSFDPQRDIDASSRHAELRPAEAGWVLVDLGSSNGTYADGRRITEVAVAHNVAIGIEFGPGGPRVRLFVGTDAEIEALAAPPIEADRPNARNLLLGALGIVVVAAAVIFALAR